jgi:hypothetical protein
MEAKKLVICTENDEVLFTGRSAASHLPPSKSGTFVAGEHAIEGEERLTIPAPAPALIEDDADAAAYCDDPPTILRAPKSSRSA